MTPSYGPSRVSDVTAEVLRLLPALRESAEPDEMIAAEVAEKIVAALDDPGPLRDRSGLDTHRVGVVVFCETTGVDKLDAAVGASLAIRQLIAGERVRRNPNAQPGVDGRTCYVRLADGAVPVRVADVMDVGMACGNGYLWVHPTAKAYREKDGD